MSNNNAKLCLGTVQMGQNYGISNSRGMIPEMEVFQILDRAYAHQIRVLDTAPVYGLAQERIGKYHKITGNKFDIITKLPRCHKDDISAIINNGLSTLEIDCLEGILIHDYESREYSEQYHEEFLKQKRNGGVKKIGFSLNSVSELTSIIDRNLLFDIVQIPFNLCDRRFYPYFELLKSRNVEIHIRSVFLQGLLIMPPKLIPKNLENILIVREMLENYSKTLHLGIETIALGFVFSIKNIDRVLIGVDSLDNLEKNIQAIHSLPVFKETDFADLIINDEKIINPSNWNV